MAAQRTLQICSGWRGGLDTLVFSGAITDSKFLYDGFFILENVNRALVARSTVPQDPFGLGAFSEVCPVNLICVCVSRSSNLCNLEHFTLSVHSVPLLQKENTASLTSCCEN